MNCIMLCTGIAFTYVYFCHLTDFRLYEYVALVVNLCVTTHVHASLVADMLGSPFDDDRLSIAAVVSEFTPVYRMRCYCLSITCAVMTCHIHHVTFPARLVASSFALSVVTQRGTDVCCQPAVCSFFSDRVWSSLNAPRLG